MSPNVGDAVGPDVAVVGGTDAAASGAGTSAAAATGAAAGAATGFASTGGAGRAGGGAIPPVERTTLRRGGAGADGSDAAAAGAALTAGSAKGDANGSGIATSGAAGTVGPSTFGSSFGALLAFVLGSAFGFGSSTIGSRRSSRLSASRRMRSADGSSMLDEWLLTPILSSSERSSTTWFSTPSSRASSYTLIFLVANAVLQLHRAALCRPVAPVRGCSVQSRTEL